MNTKVSGEQGNIPMAQTIEELTTQLGKVELELAETKQMADKAQTLIDAVKPLFIAGLYGRFHHGHGYLCSGTLRLMRADFDTNPSQEFQDALFEQVCESMNLLAEFIGPRPDPFAWIGSQSDDDA